MSLFDDLMLGIAVIVDDQVLKKESPDGIVRIRTYLEAKKIPLALFAMPPDTEIIKHFGHVNFVILDWDFFGGVGGISTSSSSSSENDVMIDFLRDLKKVCFAPVFILSHLRADYIKGVLTDYGLYDPEKIDWVFVHDKAVLAKDDGSQLFSTIEDWLKSAPSIYVLKTWQAQMSRATKDLFWDFQNIDARWPTVLWKSYKRDDDDPSSAMQDLLMRNIESRLGICKFDENIVSKRKPDANAESVSRIIEAERFLPKARLPPDITYTGDLFKREENGIPTYHLNIRAQCDLLRKVDAQLYCLRGTILKETMYTHYDRDKEQFRDLATGAIIAGVDGGKILNFDFREFSVLSWNDMKFHRVGRLLSPFITNIQQRYAHYMHRQGIPRTPSCMIPAGEPKANENKAMDVPKIEPSPPQVSGERTGSPIKGPVKRK